MSAKLKETIDGLALLTKEELLYKRAYQAVEKAKIESKILILEDKRERNKGFTEEEKDLFHRTNFALQATGIVISAIEAELSLRKQKNRKTFHELLCKSIAEHMEVYDDLEKGEYLEMLASAKNLSGEENV